MIIIVFGFCHPILSQNDNQDLHKMIRWDIGLLGTWLNYEHPIAQKWTMVGEVGLNPTFFGGIISSKGFGVAGRLSVSCRYFYDKRWRISNNKNFANNSGNFIQIVVDYQPPGFDYINVNDRNIIRELRLIPSICGRRNIKNGRFSYEARLGMGYSYLLDKVETETTHNFAYDLRFSIGYLIFKK